MLRSSSEARSKEQVNSDLEPYRRLVELQKQMIELAQQHERTRREHEVLRTQVEREIAAHLRENTDLSYRLRAAVMRLNRFIRKKPLPC
jgi:hypothetical protein